MSTTIAIAFSLAQKPHEGGHSWVLLQYLLGLRRLGYDVLFIDALEPAMCVDGHGRPCSLEASVNWRYFQAVMRQFGLDGSWAMLYDRGRQCLGLDRPELLRRVGEAPLLLNFMGYVTDALVLATAQRRVFFDIDPGFGQMWRQLGLANPFAGHNAFVTIGRNVGQPDCTIPACGLKWITTAQPIVLERWPASPGDGGPFTSVGAWRGPYGPIEFEGRTYGLRCHEFRKFFTLPHETNAPFELALDIHPADEKDVAALRASGWTLVNPRTVAADPDAYQEYIRRSRGEFMVAKNMYVQSHSGWFSDRSICYLASGRPVLAQDTAIQKLYPTDAGLLAFSTLEEAAEGVRTIMGDYGRHARAARAVAEEYFDSDKVLRRLLNELNVD